MKDALGQEISLESMHAAIAAWNELWKSRKFDCGPQEYDCMAKETLQKFGVTGQRKRQIASITCPYCGRETYAPKIANFDSILMGRLTCQHCRPEFPIEDGVPKGE